MKSDVLKIAVPSTSEISNQLTGCYFVDSYKVTIENSVRSALDTHHEIVSKTPDWINNLMALRNKIVAIVGLKYLGHLGKVEPSKSANEYRVGDRVGIFSILSLSAREVILGDSDKHLNAKVSVYKFDEGENKAVAISTVIHINNTLGKIYMLFVAPMHKLIAPAMLHLVAAGNNNA